MIRDDVLRELALSEPAPAKLNLTLDVHGRQPDGYHALESLVGFVERADTVVWQPTDAPTRCTGPFAAAIIGENLLDRVAMLWRDHAPGLPAGRFTIDKQLPVAAGIGGGSANAGAALRLLKRAFPVAAERIDWPALAAQLGSDVPVCLHGRPAIMTGRGTELTWVPPLPRLALVLVNPGLPAMPDKTARVFRAIQAPMLPAPPPPPNLIDYAGIATADGLIALMRQRGNGMTEAAIRVNPAIDMVLTALQQLPGTQHVAMTGAGPTCFAVLPTNDAAENAAHALADAQPNWWIAATRLLPG